jgi:hypothetical protein
MLIIEIAAVIVLALLALNFWWIILPAAAVLLIFGHAGVFEIIGGSALALTGVGLVWLPCNWWFQRRKQQRRAAEWEERRRSCILCGRSEGTVPMHDVPDGEYVSYHHPTDCLRVLQEENVWKLGRET